MEPIDRTDDRWNAFYDTYHEMHVNEVFERLEKLFQNNPDDHLIEIDAIEAALWERQFYEALTLFYRKRIYSVPPKTTTKPAKFNFDALINDYKKYFNVAGHAMAVMLTIFIISVFLYSNSHLGTATDVIQLLCIIFGWLSGIGLLSIIGIPLLSRIIIPIVFGLISILSLLIEGILYIIGEINNSLTKDQ